MLTLTATDTLQGNASAATSVTVTVFGQVLDAASGIGGSTTENYLILAQAQLGTAVAAIYTVAAGKTVNIRSINVVNTDQLNSKTFQLFADGAAQANAITPNFTLQPGGMATYEDANGWSFYNSSGQQLLNIFGATQKAPNSRVSNHFAESIDRMTCAETNVSMPASGTLFLQGIWLAAGTIVSNINLFSGGTAAGTPTNYFAGLYDPNRNLVAQSANQTTGAWAANSAKAFAMTAPYTVPADGMYYIGFFMTATTLPTLKGGVAKTGGQLAALTPVLHGSSTTGLTTALPATAATITTTATPIWASVS